MLTAQQLAYACLDYIGEYSLTYVEYTGNAATAVTRALLLAINAGLGELFDKNPALFKREVGVLVPAPVSGTLGVTAGSTAVTSPDFGGFTGPFAGNTVTIAGVTTWNGLGTEAGSPVLVFPYAGTTGTPAATLYGDAVGLDPALSRPLGPVWLSEIRLLQPMAGKPEYLMYDPRLNLHTDWNRFPYGLSGRLPGRRPIGIPEAFYADVRTLSDGTPQVRLFLTPLPDQQYTLRFDSAVRPAAVTSGDLGSDGDDPGRAFAFPDQNDTRFLLPLVLYAWSRSAWFKNAAAARQLAAERAAILPEIEAWKVQPLTGSHLQPGGWR